MADQETLKILQQGKDSWNNWTKINWKELPTVEIIDYHFPEQYIKRPLSFQRADLSGLDLTSFKSFNGYDFHKVNFSYCDLKGVNFSGSRLRRANFSNADLRNTKFDECDCETAIFIGAKLSESSFKKSNLQGANLSGTDVFKANFSRAKLIGTNLMWARIIETNFSSAELINCKLYGASIWNVNMYKSTQSNLIVTNTKKNEYPHKSTRSDLAKRDEYSISVDNLEIAQFIYLIISNEKIKTVIETLTSKIVLILGRFTDERYKILESLKKELAKRDFVPVIFDFQKPNNKDYIEPVLLIAGLSRFVIADFTNPKIILEEVPLIKRNTNTIIIPILKKGRRKPVTLLNIENNKTVSKTFFYNDISNLISKHLPDIITTANRLLAENN
jgi:uncharacterized protein YjbI with pentapeptide repeats